ncbi:hypothetical protein Tco_0077476 [Tanacetum coccineum]
MVNHLWRMVEDPRGYEDAIVVPKITANNFEIKHGLLNLVQNKQFFGHDKEDPLATSDISTRSLLQLKCRTSRDTVQPSTENIQPPVVQTNDQIGEPVVASKTKPTLPYPSRANKEKLREKDDLLALKFMEIFRILKFQRLKFRGALLPHAPNLQHMFRKLLNDN